MASRSGLQNTDFVCEFDGSIRSDLIYQGDAHMPTDTTNLRLTKLDDPDDPAEHGYGRIIYREPVQLWKGAEKANFETTVNFILKPMSPDDTPADGLVFFMVPVNYSFPSDVGGGNLGIYGGPKVFAVEFDVYSNSEWDPNFPHVGINIESRHSQTVVQIPESFIGKEVTLKITYVARTHVISAVVTGPEKFEISHVRNLSGVLPQKVQVGLAAATGDYVAIHDVSYWDFHSDFDKNRA